jgi:hypothetical protein
VTGAIRRDFSPKLPVVSFFADYPFDSARLPAFCAGCAASLDQDRLGLNQSEAVLVYLIEVEHDSRIALFQCDAIML